MEHCREKAACKAVSWCSASTASKSQQVIGILFTSVDQILVLPTTSANIVVENPGIFLQLRNVGVHIHGFLLS